MPTIFKNPNLTDYFIEHHDLTAPVIDAYEAAKVISLPTMKLDIDHHFWATLPSDSYPGLKKTNAQDDGGRTLRGSLDAVGMPGTLVESMMRHTQHLLDQVRPIYEKMFAGYSIERRKVTWRVNVIHNENMHLDAYKEPMHNHFARMFINLDTQPRIWKTSWTVDELYARVGKDALKRAGSGNPDALHASLNALTFGRTSKEWWDNQPRHVAYFDPGDVWIVDSRQVAHQIFYGRRAVSIDFLVDPASMANPRRQYLAIAEDFMRDQAAMAH